MARSTDSKLDGLEILYSKREVLSAVASLAKSIAEYYDGLNTVNVVPVMTGGMQFAAALLSELEVLFLEKEIIS